MRTRRNPSLVTVALGAAGAYLLYRFVSDKMAEQEAASAAAAQPAATASQTATIAVGEPAPTKREAAETSSYTNVQNQTATGTSTGESTQSNGVLFQPSSESVAQPTSNTASGTYISPLAPTGYQTSAGYTPYTATGTLHSADVVRSGMVAGQSSATQGAVASATDIREKRAFQPSVTRVKVQAPARQTSVRPSAYKPRGVI